MTGGGGETVLGGGGDVAVCSGGGDAGDAIERGVELGVENSDRGDSAEREVGVSTGGGVAGGVMKTVRFPALLITGGGVDAIVEQREAEVRAGVGARVNERSWESEQIGRAHV